MGIDYDPLAHRVRANPYPYYARLREEAPAFWVPSLEAYAISRHRDVVGILKNPGLFSSERAQRHSALLTALQHRSEMLARAATEIMLVGMDPPQHGRCRGLLKRAFTSSRIAALEPRIRAIARQHLDAMLVWGECDFMANLASPLPVTVIAEMLGIEPARRDDFRRWSNSAVASSTRLLEGADPAPFEAAYRELHDYLGGIIDERRREPRDDLISVLVEKGEQAQVLTPDEVIAFARLLLIAGNETTTNLLGNAMVALLGHPEQMELLREQPSLIPGAVEEALRYDSPVQGLSRAPVREVDIAGVTIPPGTLLLPLLASANRDPRAVDDSERFDVTRAPAPGHIAFGYGIHFCLGAPLARLEARIALEELLGATRHIAYAPGQQAHIHWGDSFLLRGPRALRLRVTRR